MMTSRDGRSPVDWAALRRRLDEAHAGLAASSEADTESTRRILEWRATRLAEPAAPEAESESIDLITFSLGRENCAVEAGAVFNVFRLTSLARLPGAAASVHGITLWRGEILAVLDLRPLLGLSAVGLSDLARVIVVGRNRAAFGFVADSVSGVRRILPSEIYPSSGESTSNPILVRGITSDAMLVLDTERLLRLTNSGAYK